jgi:type II secretory pathway pseudopilin PulG
MYATNDSGYSLIELIAIMVIIGIIFVTVGQRFFQENPYAERGYFEEVINATRYAQKLAMTSGCDTRVLYDGDGFCLHQWNNAGICTAVSSVSGTCASLTGGVGLFPVEEAGGGEFSDEAPDGVTIDTVDAFYFDAIGRPRDGDNVANFGDLLTTPLNVNVGGRQLSIEEQTGFVWCSSGC